MWGWRDRESPDSGRRKLFQMWLHIYTGNTWDLAYGCPNEEQEIYLKWCSWATCIPLKATGNSPIISEVNGHSPENCDSSKSSAQQKGSSGELLRNSLPFLQDGWALLLKTSFRMSPACSLSSLCVWSPLQRLSKQSRASIAWVCVSMSL